MSDNHTKPNVKASHGAHNQPQAGKRYLLQSLAACRQVNAKLIATDDSSGYYRGLSKLISDLPSRTSLAFFVPDICIASQAKQDNSTALIHLPASRKHGGNTVYDGLTLQNKIAERRICGAVSNKTESKTRHPIRLPYCVAFTQNLTGVIHHG